jgi:D-alanyl-D-alanine carboxypeptidase/D-alanyl-D-alanine-endopeptidase (penicillin-binding protein 4)
MKSKSVVGFISLILAMNLVQQHSAQAAEPALIKAAFTQLAKNNNLANPAVIVVDESTGEVVFEKNSLVGRKPASVIKLLTGAAAYTYLSPSDSYTTSLWMGIDTKTAVIQGSLDPWTTFSSTQADKLKRTSLGKLAYSAMTALGKANAGDYEGTTLYYSNLYPQDVAALKTYFKERNLAIVLQKVSDKQAKELSLNQIFISTSPTLQVITDWMMTWSDNVLAERIARSAASAAGFSRDYAGVAKVFRKLMTGLGIDTKNLVVKDGSGLSRENRVTAQQISQLLMVMARDEKLSSLITGLPIGGVSGTLTERFVETAPTAVGLVRAKTGTLNGTTNLAGYVESQNKKYIFVIIADKHSRSYTITKRVRASMDKALGKIAKPLLPVFLPVDTSTAVSESATSTIG